MTLRVLLLALISLTTIGLRGMSSDLDLDLVKLLASDFTADESRTWKEAKEFKDRFNISDDVLCQALAEIRREATKKRSNPVAGSRDQIDGRRMLIGVITWLPLCHNAQTKPWLLDVAATMDEDGLLRTVALFSYLRIADAPEAHEVLTRFLVSDAKMNSDSRSSILRHARTVYIEADLEKKRAIIESLHVTLANEDAKWLFRVNDNILSRLSQQSAHSRQRRAILKRLINATPTCLADELALPDLKARLTQLQKFTPITNITTNLTALNSRDFSQPPPGGDAVAADASPASHLPPHAPAATPLRGFWLYAIGGVVVLSMATAGVWMYRKRRK